MITFSPIHKNIQETLFKKMDMLDKNINSYSIGTTRATDDGNTNENYMYARSVFLRMTSLLTYNKKPIIIMGGEMREGKFKSGYDDLYGKRSTTDENKMRRPIAGIKDINVEYKGGGMKLGATRTTSVSWTCWTWEELQRFKPFFLKHGRSVLIEFGWSFSGADKPIMLDIIDNKGELKESLLIDKDGRSLSEILPEHILKQKGHYDAVLGIIQNFEFTVNESGGFDCTTDIISLGVNTLQKMDSKENMMGNISRLPIKSTKEGGFLGFFQKDEFLKLIADKNPYYNFVAYMKSLQGHLHKNAEASKGTIAYFNRDFEPYCTWGWFEDNVLSRFVSIVNEKNEVVTEFRSIENVYDDAGNLVSVQPIKIRNSKDVLSSDFNKWFLLNNEDGMVLKILKTADTSTAFDLKLNYGPDFHFHTGGSNRKKYMDQWIDHFGKIPTEGDDKSFRVFTVIKEPNNATIDETQYGVSAEGTGRSYLIIEDEQKEAIKKPSVSKFNQKEGILRNVYFHWKFLMNSFVEALTIKGGILKVWDTFSGEYGGIYDFVIDYDDKEGRLLIRDKGFSENSVIDVLKNTSKNPKGGGVYDNKGVFVFPIWEKNSMVKSQNLSAKLPSRMQVAAMYGSNKPEVEDGVVDNYDDWGGIALGKAEKKAEEETLHIFEKEAERQDLYDSLIGSMAEPFRRGEPKINNKGEVIEPGEIMTFGNASANITKKLRWVEGGGACTNTTGIYEDLKKEDADSGYDEMVLGINEVLNEQLKGEFQSRLKEAIGLNEEGELPKGVKKDVLSVEGVKKMEEIWNQKDGTDQKSNFWNNIYHAPKWGDSGKMKAPIMKAEYVGMMKISLKDPGGLLKQSDPIIPIELELDIDGTGGIFPGNTFHSSYLPQSYMDRICFQVKGASQKIDATGWTTTLQGQMRVGVPEFVPVIPSLSEWYDSMSEEEQREYDIKTGAPEGHSGKDRTIIIPAGTPEGEDEVIVIQPTLESKLREKLERERDLKAYNEVTPGTDEYKEITERYVNNIRRTDDHWEADNLLSWVNTAESSGKGTGNEFLSYMMAKQKNTSIFPQEWFSGDHHEIGIGYNNWLDSISINTPGD